MAQFHVDKPANFLEVREALTLSTWMYYFGKGQETATNVAFNYGFGPNNVPPHYVDDMVKEHMDSNILIDHFVSDPGCGLTMAIFFANKKIYVAFGGVEYRELKDFFSPVQTAQDDLGNDIRVHHGFNFILQKHMTGIMTALRGIQTRHAGAEIVITGHGLGGALSTLMGYYAAKDMPKSTIRVVSFAAPRVGNDAFRRAHDNMANLTHTRVVNKRDISVTMWVDDATYAQVGNFVVHLTGKNVVNHYHRYSYPEGFFSVAKCFNLADHFCIGYWSNLENRPEW